MQRQQRLQVEQKSQTNKFFWREKNCCSCFQMPTRICDHRDIFRYLIKQNKNSLRREIRVPSQAEQTSLTTITMQATEDNSHHQQDNNHSQKIFTLIHNHLPCTIPLTVLH